VSSGSDCGRVAIRAWDLLVALPLPPDVASDAAPEFLDPPSGPVLLRVSLGPHEVAFEPPPSDRAAFARRLVETSDAFVLHDPALRAWTIGRGRTGLRTLYHLSGRDGRATFAACTQLRPLLAFLDRKPALDLDGIRRYLCNGFFSDPETPFVGVRSLLPGEVREQARGERDWRTIAVADIELRPPMGDGAAEGLPPGERVRERLVRAVEARTADVSEVACLLSGGVDSSTVAAVAARILGKPVRTYSLVFEDEELSEAKYATAVAKKIGAVHENVLLRQDDFEASLDWLLGALDLPTADAVNSLLISRAIARAGHDAALCGVGSDELFGGHECMRRVPRAMSFLSAYRRAPAFARAAFRGSARLGLGIWGDPWLPSRGIRGKFLDLLDEPEDALAVYLLSRRVLVPDAVEKLLPGAARNGFRSVPEAVAERFERSAREETLTKKLSFYERHVYLSNQLVRDLGMVSVATGLDVRLPFLDRDLVDTVWSLPESEVFLEGRPKTFLIRSVSDVLPVEAYDRPKLGFVLPIGRWLGGAITSRLRALTATPDLLDTLGLDGEILERIVTDCASARGRIFFTREWCLFVLLDWCSRNLRRAGAS
jgi:asparagine synthase (glutamine-hydrolysing)